MHQIDDFSLPLEGELVAVEVDGTDVAVAVLDGQLHAFDDTCPHAGCSLAEGELEDQSVVCPCHFARFDITTGAVVKGSAASGVSIWTAQFQDGRQLDGPQDPRAGADQDRQRTRYRQRTRHRRHRGWRLSRRGRGWTGTSRC